MEHKGNSKGNEPAAVVQPAKMMCIVFFLALYMKHVIKASVQWNLNVLTSLFRPDCLKMCVSYYQVIDMIGDCFGTRLDEWVIIFPFHI